MPRRRKKRLHKPKIILKKKGKEFLLDVKAFDMQAILLATPPKRVKTSGKQTENESRFKEAIQYANQQMEIPEAKAEYAKRITSSKNNAHAVARADYLIAPVIHSIKIEGYTGKPGERITIKATDDFRVTAVKVSIISGDGSKLETGDAVRVRLKPNFWRYHTTKENSTVAGMVIKVYAYDRPGNRTEGEWREGEE